MRQTSLNSQAGFTLVEIAIVLVIIGVLLGGVLKGTEMIDNSKVKRAVNDINGVSAAYYGYIDRYRNSPGDDGNLTSLQGRGANWTDISQAGNANGILTANRNQTWNAASGTEHAAFWQHLRASGLIAGDHTAVGLANQPRNAFGGSIGVVTQPVNGNLRGTKVCLSQVPGKSASAIDSQLDDGFVGTGRTRSTIGGNNPQNTNPNNTALGSGVVYDESNYYTLCTQI